MAQAATANPNKVTHTEIPIKFGRERAIDFTFNPRERNWTCLKNASITDRSNCDTDRDVQSQLNDDDKAQLFERKKTLEGEMRMLKDVKARLEVHRLALRLVVAESLKDYHEQFKMILALPQMPIVAIGPELLELNRDNLKLQLDMSKIVPQTEEQQRQIESRISERLGAHLSNLSSPEHKSDPQPPRSVNTRNPSNEKPMAASDDGGKSTAMSTQRPPQIRSNSGLSPQAAPGPNSAQRGSRNVQTTSSGESKGASAAASSQQVPTPSAKAVKLLTTQKKNATITEEEDETDQSNQ